MLGIIVGGLAVIIWVALFAQFLAKKQETSRFQIGFMYVLIILCVIGAFLMNLAFYLSEGGR